MTLSCRPSVTPSARPPRRRRSSSTASPGSGRALSGRRQSPRQSSSADESSPRARRRASPRLSYTALGDLLAGLVDELDDELPAPQRRALDVALLRASPDAGPVDARAVGAATLGLLRAESRRAPLLVAVDDLQWLDAASGAAVAFALRRLAGEPVLLLATERRGRDAQSIDMGLAPDRITRIGVGPLDLDALHRILHDRLGEPVPRPALARLADVSGGNPYYALELARAALREAGSGGLGAELTLPDGIYAVLQDRLRALPDDTGEALGGGRRVGPSQDGCRDRRRRCRGARRSVRRGSPL